MEKIIVKNNSNLRAVEALELVKEVISGGKISGKESSNQYCYLSIFGKKHQVSCVKNKGESFTFRIENIGRKS